MLASRVGATVPQVITANPSGTVSNSVPVWIVTVRGPVAARGSMLIVAVKLPALETVTGPDCPTGAPPTLIPGPKPTVVSWLTQFVPFAVIITARADEPGAPAFRDREETEASAKASAGLPADK